VQLGAVVAIDARSVTSSDAAGKQSHVMLAEPLECVDVVGRSLVERMIEHFVAIDAVVSVLVEAGTSLPASFLPVAQKNVTIEVVSDLGSAITYKLDDYARQGIEYSFINWANAYAETDLLDLFCFHREARQTVTRTFDKEGPLSLCVVDCANAQSTSLGELSGDAESNGSSKYFIREYVARLAHPRDLRQLATDILRGRCQTGPSGRQIRSGIWIDERAEIHRRARLVAPAYIGRGSKVKADALVTRFSSIERDCCIDCGTVIEDSSILPNTSIGIWLDLCHGVASANKLLNLERDVVVEISDPSIMRSNADVRQSVVIVSERGEEPKKAADSDLRAPRQIADTWRFGDTLIQE
jgi:hypothetical protein